MPLRRSSSTLLLLASFLIAACVSDVEAQAPPSCAQRSASLVARIQASLPDGCCEDAIGANLARDPNFRREATDYIRQCGHAERCAAVRCGQCTAECRQHHCEAR